MFFTIRTSHAMCVWCTWGGAAALRPTHRGGLKPYGLKGRQPRREPPPRSARQPLLPDEKTPVTPENDDAAKGNTADTTSTL